MASARVAGAPTPLAANLELVDAHRLLRRPDGLADSLSQLDCAEAARVVDYIAGYLSTAPQVDGVGVIDQLAFVYADDRPGQSSMRSLSYAVAALVANCMQFVADDDTEIIIEFVSSVPLVYGFDVLRKLGAAYGLVQGVTRDDVVNSTRHVAPITATGHAIDIWRERAQRAITSGYVMEEGHLFVFLDGLACLGAGASGADAIAAVRAFCSDVPGGLAYFLEQARKLRGFRPDATT